MIEELDPKVYPIGKAQNLEFTKDVLYHSILMIESAPLRLKQRIATLNEGQKVSYELATNKGKTSAVNIKAL